MADLTPTQLLIGMLGGDASASTELQPALGADQLAQLLADALVPDDQGRWTDDADYVATYDLNRAAGKGWRLRAGKVAMDYSMQIEGRGMSRSQMYDHCIAQAKEYERKAAPRSFRADGGMDPFFLWSRDR